MNTPASAIAAETPAPPPVSSKPAPATPQPVTGKLKVLVDLLQRPQGASIFDLADATGWQFHSIRGALAGALKARGYTILSEKLDKVRIYRSPPPAPPRRGRKKVSA